MKQLPNLEDIWHVHIGYGNLDNNFYARGKTENEDIEKCMPHADNEHWSYDEDGEEGKPSRVYTERIMDDKEKLSNFIEYYNDYIKDTPEFEDFMNKKQDYYLYDCGT